MLTTFLLWTLLVVIAGSIVHWLYKRSEFRKLIDKIPGPPVSPITGNLGLILCSPEKLWCRIRWLAKEYYPIYRLWSGAWPTIMIFSPEDIEILISSTKNMEKSLIYNSLHTWLGTGLLTSTGDKWHMRRKLLTPAFHFNILLQFMSVFAEQSDLLINELKEECSKPFTDILPHVSRFTLHTICETAMGTQLQSKTKKQENYRQAIYRMGNLIVHRLTRPWLYPDWMFYFSKAAREQQTAAQTLQEFSLDVIRKRSKSFINTHVMQENEEDLENPTKKRLAMLDLLISARNSGANIDEEGIREEVDTFMFEGHDTTAMSISFTLLLLACHQDVQDRVLKELDEVLGNSKDHPTYQQLQELKYLELVIKESLRIYPSVPFISRMTSEELHTHTGYVISEGIIVNVSIYDLHHDPRYYPDPHKFDPDRFLPENTQKRHPFAYLPFSAGPRNCIGQKFAMLELKTVISKILLSFSLHPYDKPKDIIFVADIIIRTKGGIKIKLQPRN